LHLIKSVICNNMEDQNLRKIYEEYYLCRNLYQLIVNDFSMYLSYVHGTNGKNRIEDYKAEINGGFI